MFITFNLHQTTSNNIQQHLTTYNNIQQQHNPKIILYEAVTEHALMRREGGQTKLITKLHQTTSNNIIQQHHHPTTTSSNNSNIQYGAVTQQELMRGSTC